MAVGPVGSGAFSCKGMKHMTGKKAHAAPKKNRSGMVLIIAVICILMVVLLTRCMEIERRNAVYADEISGLKEQMTEEEGRTSQIEAYKDYTDTDAYVEKTAREKFGLVYPDEIIFKQEG